MECNGQDDCRDNSDEHHCGSTTSTTSRYPTRPAISSSASPSTSESSPTSSTCDDDEFHCGSGTCISKHKVYISLWFHK